MKPETKEKLKQAITDSRDFQKEFEDHLEEIKRRKKEIEDEARERRRKVAL